MNVKIPNIPKGAAGAASQTTNAQTGQNASYSQQAHRRTSDQARWRKEAWNEYSRRKQHNPNFNVRIPNKYPDWLLSDPLNTQNLRTLKLLPVPPSYILFIPELKANYRQLARIHHPDTLPPDSDPVAKEAAAKKFQEISMAYNQLLLSVKQHEKDKLGVSRDDSYTV
ncbi:J domain-containing protein [archaeon]|nr:MAG: J domain-containing protein [archaeon]